MRGLGVLAGWCFLITGCAGSARVDPKQAAEAGAIYEAVLKVELKNAGKGKEVYLFVDGKEPEPDLLERLQKRWPTLQPGSKAPPGKADRVSLDGLKWIDSNTVELHGTFSNGMDGRGNRYRLVSKDGAWVVKQVVLEVIS